MCFFCIDKICWWWFLSEVQVDYYLFAINELSEVTETLKTTGFLAVQWTDAFLQWNPDDYGGIDRCHWPQVGCFTGQM